MQRTDIDNIFTHHPPSGSQTDKYVALRAKAKELAHMINENCPDSREKSMAITHVQEAMMCANASIAIHES